MNLRNEINQLSTQGFRWYGIRHADLSKTCICVTDGTGGVRNPLPSCKRCFGTGHLFTDYLAHGYGWPSVLGTAFRTGPGQISTQTRNFVFRYDSIIAKFDLVLDLSLDLDTGDPIQPFKILKVYEIQDSSQMAGFEGRLEFWKCIAEERNLSNSQVGEQGTSFKHTISQ